jgi:hypothetical protein
VAQAPQSLSETVEGLRQSDARFHHVQVEVHGATLYVGGENAAPENIMAFARALSAVPGVERVVIRNPRY